MEEKKLTKVDKGGGGGGFCQKLMSATYQIHMAKIMTFAPLGPFLPFLKGPLNSPVMDIFKSYIFFQFSFVILNLLAKNMFI